MATRIYDTDTKQVVTMQVLNANGINFLNDVIGGVDYYGWASADMPEDADFAMDSESTQWRQRWADREQEILNKANEIGGEATNKLCELADLYGHDMETLQDREEEYLGI